MTSVESCRLCALKQIDCINIYDTRGIALNLEFKCMKYLNIQVTVNDVLPKVICQNCNLTLDLCSKFIDTSHLAQVKLNQTYLKSEELGMPLFVRGNYGTEMSAESLVENIKETIFGPQKKHHQPNGNHNAMSLGSDTSLIKGTEISKESLVKSIKKTIYKAREQHEEVDDNQEAMSIEDETSISILFGGTGEPDLEALSSYFSEEQNLYPDQSEEETNKKTKVKHEKIGKDEFHQCYHCSEFLASEEALIRHLRNHVWKCKTCTESFDTRSLFREHMKSHGVKSNAKPEMNGKPKISDTKWPREKISEDETHKCYNCGDILDSKQSLIDHVREHLENDTASGWQCDICNAYFSNKFRLEAHVKQHKGIKDYTCNLCGKSFVQLGNLENHLTTHSTEKKYSCHVCQKEFKTQALVKSHLLVHIQLKPHICNECGRSFRHLTGLKEHERIHTGEMPYSCELCGKKFRFRGSFTVHTRTHTGEKPYACELCSARFRDFANRSKHMKLKHEMDVSGKDVMIEEGVSNVMSLKENLKSVDNQDEILDQSMASCQTQESSTSSSNLYQLNINCTPILQPNDTPTQLNFNQNIVSQSL